MERRNTKQRQIVLNAVRSRCDHPTAEQIYAQVKEIDPKISLGTVYRNLALLAEEGQILSIKLSDADRFDLTVKGHDHFICLECGGVFDMIGKYDLIPDNTSTEDGFLISSHQTIIKGLCPNCTKKTEEKR